MDVQFCDLCNESVPLAHLNQGRAVRRNDRVICANCEGAMSAADGETPVSAGSAAAAGAAAGAGAAGRGGTVHERAVERVHRGSALWLSSLSLAVALLAICGVALGWLNFKDQLDRDRTQSKGQETRMARIAELEAVRVSGRMTQRLEAMERSQTEGTVLIGELRTRLDQLLQDNDVNSSEFREVLARTGARLDRVDAVPEKLARTNGELATVAQTQTEFFTEVRALRDRLQRLEVEGIARAVSNMGAVLTEDTQLAGSSWLPVLDDLKSENAGTRWEAVQRLGDTRDVGVVEHLTAHIADSDLFVRMAVARVLGDLGSGRAVPALIEGLEDEEPSVREAAVVSLRSLTGKEFRFDPTAKPADRSKRVKAWRGWWEKEGRGTFPPG